MYPTATSSLLQMLAAASDPLQAKAAEAALEQAAATPGFASALLSVASASPSLDSNNVAAAAAVVPVEIRQAAALYLKNLVIRPHWSDDTENFRAPLVRERGLFFVFR